MIIDGTNLILGRVATVAAKRALEGENISIVNCEKIIITGRKALLLKEFKARQDRGHALKGPFYPKMPDRIVKRVIRGMLPYRKLRGKEALKKIRCYIGLPDEFKNQKLESIEDANASKLRTLKYITINDLAKFYGKDFENG